MKKVLLSIVLSVVMILTFVACSGGMGGNPEREAAEGFIEAAKKIGCGRSEKIHSRRYASTSGRYDRPRQLSR